MNRHARGFDQRSLPTLDFRVDPARLSGGILRRAPRGRRAVHSKLRERPRDRRRLRHDTGSCGPGSGAPPISTWGPETTPLLAQAAEAIRSVPGVQSTALASPPPMLRFCNHPDLSARTGIPCFESAMQFPAFESVTPSVLRNRRRSTREWEAVLRRGSCRCAVSDDRESQDGASRVAAAVCNRPVFDSR